MRDMENLCEDMIFEILISLPEGFLRDPRLVCRSWSAVMQSPSFCKVLCSRHSSSKSKLAVQFGGGSVRLLNLKHGKLERRRLRPGGRLLATSGGVLLVLHRNYDERKNSLYARNPLTRQQAELPPLPIDLPIDDGTAYHPGYDILRNSSIAYIPGVGEYKVVCPYVERYSGMVCFFVSTLGTNMSWRRIDPSSTIFPNGIHDDSRYSALEWKSVSAEGIIYFYRKMVAVDLSSENIHAVSLPTLPILRLPRDPEITQLLDLVYSTDYRYVRIGEQLGRIEYVDRGREESFDLFSVAVLEGFGSSNCYWSELSFHRNSVAHSFNRAFDDVAWLDDSDTLICMSNCSDRIVTYNVKSGEIKKIAKKSPRVGSLFVHTNHFGRW